MKHWRATLACVLAAVLAGPAAWLQIAAWSGMAINYSAESGVTRGIAETFDGSRPCALCHAASALRQDDESSEKRTEEVRSLRIEWSAWLSAAFFPLDRGVEVILCHRRFELARPWSGSPSPDVPPPREV